MPGLSSWFHENFKNFFKEMNLTLKLRHLLGQTYLVGNSKGKSLESSDVAEVSGSSILNKQLSIRWFFSLQDI